MVPDGLTLAFEQQTDIWVIRADGKGALQLTSHEGLGRDRSADWSPDGRQIAYVRAGPAYSKHHVFLMSSNGARERRLTSEPRGSWSPCWSPVAQRVAFFAVRDKGLYVAAADGSRPTRLSGADVQDDQFEPAPCPKWSPDGRTILFTRQSDLYLVRADGGNPRRLAVGGIAGVVSRRTADRVCVAGGAAS